MTSEIHKGMEAIAKKGNVYGGNTSSEGLSEGIMNALAF